MSPAAIWRGHFPLLLADFSFLKNLGRPQLDFRVVCVYLWTCHEFQKSFPASGRIKAYFYSGKWWPEPVIRNRYTDNGLYDTYFLRAGDSALRLDPEQLIGVMQDVSTVLSNLLGYRDDFQSSMTTSTLL